MTSSDPLVLVTNQVPKEHFPALAELPLRWEFATHPETLMPREELLDRVSEAQVIISQGEVLVDEALLERAPHLKIVANVAIGTDNFDVEAMARRGVWATNAPDAFTASTADATLALLLAVTRNVVRGDRYVREGIWHDEGMRPARWEGPLLGGLTLGLVGYGKIARAVEERARAFGMTVLHTRQSPDGSDGFRELEDLVRAVDVLSLHIPLTESTRHLIDASLLAKMKPGGYLINLARGAVVDEAALLGALQSGQLAGAGLDVFPQEPYVAQELRALPQVVLTPHLGGAARQARLAARAVAAENVAAVLRGELPQTPVNHPHV